MLQVRRLQTVSGRLNKLDVVQFGLRGLLLPFRVKHLHGPRQVVSGVDDVVAISVIRDGESWLKSFLSHHRQLGVRHFVILDNGSSDRTIEILSKQPDVTLLQTNAPYHAYENTMKRYLAERYCRKRWCLCVDVDELFDFPYSTKMPLSGLIRYLNDKRFNSVITQMLDMFDEAPLAAAKNDEDMREKYCFYDTSNISRTKYEFGRVPNPRIMMHHGGIRKTIFGTNNGLTKVSLFMMDGRLKPFVQWHHARNARLADISCVLLHFPFVGSFTKKVEEAVESGRYGYLTTDEYVSYLNGLRGSPQLHLKRESARTLVTVDELLESKFLFASTDYSSWVNRLVDGVPCSVGAEETTASATGRAS